MTIEEGVVVRQDGKFSSLIENGWYNGNQNTTKEPSNMVIHGGTFTGGLNTIKNDDYGKLTINGGTFTNVAQAAVLNWNETTINNGTFVSDQAVILNGKLDDEMDKGKLIINDGSFTAGGDHEVIEPMSGGNADSLTDIRISGGTFSGDVSAYVEAGNKIVETEDGFIVAPNTEGVTLDASKQTLRETIPMYLGVLLRDEYQDYIAEIIIEGHTDTVGSYLSNQQLSYNRANSVARFCLDSGNGLNETEIARLQQVLTVNGRSFSNPVYTAEAPGAELQVDMDASRRVEIKFRLKEDEMIEKISEILRD